MSATTCSRAIPGEGWGNTSHVLPCAVTSAWLGSSAALLLQSQVSALRHGLGGFHHVFSPLKKIKIKPTHCPKVLEKSPLLQQSLGFACT